MFDLATGLAAIDWATTVDFTSLTTTAEGIATTAIPVIIAIVGIRVGIKLIKRFGGSIG